MDSIEWYDVIDGKSNVSQGDIIVKCPLFIPKYPPDIKKFDFANIENNLKNIPIRLFSANVIVMSQACDLEVRKCETAPKLSSVVVAALRDVRKNKVGKASTLPISKLDIPQRFLLESSSSELKMNFQIVEFGSLYTIPWNILNEFVKNNGKRLRLKSPYMQQLSQHFGRFFSRVATPEDRANSIEKYFDAKSKYEEERKNNNRLKAWEELSQEEVKDKIERLLS